MKNFIYNNTIKNKCSQYKSRIAKHFCRAKTQDDVNENTNTVSNDFASNAADVVRKKHEEARMHGEERIWAFAYALGFGGDAFVLSP